MSSNDLSAPAADFSSSASPGPADPVGATTFQDRVVAEFRANAGVVGGFLAGSDLLLLTTVGARTGRHRTVPLGYLDVGGRRLVVASAGGSDRDPAWLHNLRAHPEATVEVGGTTYRATAALVAAAARDVLWDEVVRRAPGYGDYQRSTTRTIALVELRRLGDAG